MPIDIVQMSCLYDVVPFYSIQKLYKLNDIHDIFVLLSSSSMLCISYTVAMYSAHDAYVYVRHIILFDNKMGWAGNDKKVSVTIST